MRHRRKRSDFNRQNDHQVALVRNLATSFLEHGRIQTTARRAQAVQQMVEPMISRAVNSDDKMNAIRYAKGKIFTKTAVDRLFREIAPKFNAKQSGFTRTVKLGNRPGDNASKVLLELAY